MFKAVAQAVFKGDESRHKEVRKNVVDFITFQRWEKFSESIEVQHINGNNLLQRQWAKDPKQAYKMYMTLDGTLGSITELAAAGELFHYNFATIQEYCTSSQRTYRVENCILVNHKSPDFHYFYFTGDFDNGHWEYIRNMSGHKIDDGTYYGRYRTLISGEEVTVEEWLKRETENDNEANNLKIPTNRALYARIGSPSPLDNKGASRNGVRINGVIFSIANVEATDLFSVLAQECMQSESSAQETESILMKHRFSYFEDINYKLITQPWSHNFTTEAIKYCAYPSKGNIQDLISAADLYSFSFVLFMKLKNGPGGEVHQCKFTHVDRWGGESDRLLHFFMRLLPAGENGNLIAKWWRLIPLSDLSARVTTTSPRKPVPRLDEGDCASGQTGPVTGPLTWSKSQNSFHQPTSRPTSAISLNLQGTQPLARVATPGRVSGKSVSYVNCRERDLQSIQESVAELWGGCGANEKVTTTKIRSILRSKVMDADDTEQKTDAVLMKDYQKIFGSTGALSQRSDTSSRNDVSPMTYRESRRLLKKQSADDKSRPATGKDLLQHPEKVQTVVKVSDRSHSGKEIFYKGAGYIKPNEVLADLKSQGLIKLSKSNSRLSSAKPSLGEMETQTNQQQRQTKPGLRELWDENFNIIEDPPRTVRKQAVSDKSSESDMSFDAEQHYELLDQVNQNYNDICVFIC